MFKITFVSVIFISTLLSSTSDFLGGNSCSYFKNKISYRNTESSGNRITLGLLLKPENDQVFCQEIFLKRSFTSSINLETKDSSLLSFLFDEYLSYSIQISTSSKIVKKLLNFKELKRLQKMNKEKIRNIIRDIGFDLSEVDKFVSKIINKLTPLDIYCLDRYTVYYNQEIDRLKMVQEYAQLFQEYKLNTSISDKVFEDIINIKIRYIKSLKKVFLLSLSENM